MPASSVLTTHPVRRAGILALAAGGLFVPRSLPAQGGPEGVHTAIDRLVAPHVAANGTGLSVAVVVGGKLAFAKGYGRRALEPEQPVAVDTRFAIGSITKQFTCACVFKLVEAGKLDVHATVDTWFPDLARADEVTVLDLMNHVSGYRDYYPLDFVDARMRTPIAPDELLRQYAAEPLDFAPGTEWSYSNTGYVLLGRIVETVSGRPFGAFLRDELLEPLGLDGMRFDDDRPADARDAHGYTRFALGPNVPCSPEAAGWIGAAGGLWGTASDLAQWDLALLAGRVVSPASRAMMTTPRVLRDGRVTTYGCGLGLGMRGARATWGHTGAVDGFVAANMVVPSAGVAVVVLGNHGDGFGNLVDAILDVVLATPTHVPEVTGPDVATIVAALFGELQRGAPDRARWTADFAAYVTDARLDGAKAALAPLGAVEGVDVRSVRERGGMQVASAIVRCAQGRVRATLYRLPDGTIAQFFVERA